MNKYDYKALKNIDVKIQFELDRLGIPNTGSLKEALRAKANFYIINSHYNNQKIIFKARMGDHRVIRQWGKNFRNERRLIKTLTFKEKNSSLLKRMPNYISSGSKNVEWLIYEYIEGKVAGHSCSYYESPSKEEIEAIIDLLLDIQSFPIKEFCQKHSWTKTVRSKDFQNYHDTFVKIIKREENVLVHYFSNQMLNEADRILHLNKALLNQSCSLLAHGDLHPGNIIIDTKEKAKAIDWEWFRIDNAAFDPATLWFRVIEYPTLRRFLLLELAKKTHQKEIFDQLFRLNVLARMPGEISIRIKKLSNPSLEKEELDKAKRHVEICYNNYRSALKGEELEKYD